MKLKFLGTGTSVGVPQIGCECPTCTSTDARDMRRRCSAYISYDGGGFLIDTPPEMREACIQYGIKKVDAVVLTHSHMDHVAGFDDVRRFNTINGVKGEDGKIIGKPMNCYAMSETAEQMRRIFPYVKPVKNELGLYRPMIEFKNDDVFKIGPVNVTRLKVEHNFPCSGYLLEDNERKIGYISDCHSLPDETVEILQGVDVMILNCLRERFHPTHMNLELTIKALRKIKPKKSYTIHMCHDLSHVQWLEKLPEGTEPAYDGLEI